MADLIRMNHLPKCKIASFDLPEVLQNLSESDSYFKNNPEIELIQGSLPESLKEFLNKISQPVDFAIVDAQHSYSAVLEELEIVHSRLKPGSYVFCHDYRENDPKYEGIVYAADRFAKNHGYNILQLNNSNLNDREVVWGAALLRKPAKKRSFLKFFYYNLQTAGTAFLSKLKK